MTQDTKYRCRDENNKFLSELSDWRADYEGDESTGLESTIPILDEDDETFCMVVNQDMSWEDKTVEKKADFITCALNNHESMLAALEYVIKQDENNEEIDYSIIYNAVNKAKGGAR